MVISHNKRRGDFESVYVPFATKISEAVRMRKKTVLAPISTGLVLLSLLTIIAPTASALTTKARSYYENKQTVGGTRIENHGSYFEVWNNGLVDNFPSSLIDSYANTENYERVAYSVHKSAKKGRSFTPLVKNTFSWHPTPYIKRVGPKENYVEKDNIEVIPYPRSLLGGRLKYVEVWDNRGTENKSDDVLLENIPRWQISPKGLQVTDGDLEVAENFVSFRPPGKSVYLFTLENVRINGRKPPFHTRNILDNPQVSLDVKLSNFGGKLKKTVVNSNPSFLENYYITGLGNVGAGDVGKLSGLVSELEYLPIYQDGDLLENAKCSLSLSKQEASLSFSANLKERHKGFACASGRLGSHSISWTVSSETDWWDSSSPSENDVRTTISSGQLELLGDNIDNGLYYSFDHAGGSTVVDLTSNNLENITTTDDNVWYGAGRFDNALAFENASPGTATDTGLNLDNWSGLTVMVWVKTENGGVIYQDRGPDDTADHIKARFVIGANGGGTASGEINFGEWDGSGSNVLENTTADDGTWRAVAVQVDYSTDEVELFEDNSGNWESLGTGTLDGGYDSGPGHGIGYRPAHNDQYFDGKLDELTFVQGLLSENQMERWLGRTKPSEMTGGDLKTGTWTSKVWDSGNAVNIIENIDYNSTVGSGENVLWNVEATDTDENTGWFQDEDNLIAQSELPNNIRGENFQLSIKLETDNTTHSPSIQDYTLNVDPVPTVQSVSVDNSLIDRDIDYSGSGADDNCTITATVRDNDGLANLYQGDNAPQLSIKDSAGSEVAHRPVAWENLVGYWDMQDYSDLSVEDRSSDNNTGTYYNETLNQGTLENFDFNENDGWREDTPDNSLHSLEFDGENDYVDLGDLSGYLDGKDLTIAFWVYFDNISSWRSPFCHRPRGDNDRWTGFETQSGEGLGWGVDEGVDGAGGSIFTDTDPPTGEWLHVTGTYDYDTGDLAIYWNGELKETGSIGSETIVSGVTAIGRKGGAGRDWMDGTIDDVRIYDRALDNSEIQSIYENSAPVTDNLVARYNFDTGRGTTAYDTHIWTDENRGRALEFDGVDDYVEGSHDSSLNPQGPMTILAWYKTDVVDGNFHQIAGKAESGGDGSYKLYQSASNVFSFRVTDGADVYFPSGTTTVEAGKWYFLTGRVTSTDVEIWVNGSKEASVSGGIGNSQGVFAFGTDPNNIGGQLVDGIIDYVRIYDRALSENEIREIYRSGLRYHEVDENTVEISTAYNPSDSLADSRLGGFDAKARGVDNAGATDNLASSNLFTVGDWSTSVSYSPEYDSIYKGENLTVSGTADPIGITDNADNVWIDDEYAGTFYADPSANDWSSTYKVSAPVDSTVQENVRIKYQGSVLDGKVVDSYTVKNNVRVENIQTYDAQGNSQDTFGLGENVVMKFESLDNRGRFGIDTSNLTLTDPTGLNRIDHQQTLSYSDVFGNEDNWDDLTANHWEAGDYFGSPDNEYACGPNGGSSSYEDLTLIKESTLENRENIAITAQTCIDYETEDRVGFVFRYQDNQNYCEAFWTDYYSSAGIAVHEAGDVYTKSVSFFPDNGKWYKMKVVATGREATLYINGNKKVTHYDLPGFGKGRTGLRADAGYTYFDNLTINHAKGEVDASLDNGYRYRYEYTIPENGDLVGTWDIVPEAKATNGATDNATSTFSVAENAPVIKSTDFYDSSLSPVSEYTAGENMRIRSDVIDSKGRDNLKSVRAIIINPEGTQKENVAMASVDTISNGYTYEENYTIPREDASEGIWNVRIYAEDVDGYSLIENNYIHDRITDPEIGPMSTRNQDLENLKVLPLEDNLVVRADVSDPNGRDNISEVNVSIFNQDGAKVVDSASMAAVENIENGRTYEYEYSIPRSKDNFGSWRVEVFSTDGPFTSTISKNFKIEWRYLDYEWRKPIELEEKLGVSRTNEESGFELTIPTSKWDQDNGIRVTTGGGEEVPFRVWKGWTSESERHILVNFLENIGADENSTYYVYYDNSATGASYPNYENKMSRTMENVAFAKWFYTHETGQITYPKSVDVGNVNGGSKEIAVFGQTKAGTETDRAFVRLYNLDFNSPSDASLTQVDNERWYTDNNTFAYGGKIFDVNGDGDNEIVVGGVAQDNDSPDNNRGQLSVWDYDSGSFGLLDNATWEAGKTSVYGLAVSDMDGDGTVEIATAGQTDSGDNAELRIWDFSNGTLSLQTSGKFSIASGHSDRWYSAETCNLGFNTENNIVVSGVGENADGVLYGIAGIYSYDGTTLTRNDTITWQKGGEVTEFFGLDCGDVDQDGDTELTISGNWYDGTRDRAFFRVYNTKGGAFNFENWRDWYLKGRGSALTNIIKDTDYDNIKELTTVGFANDGSLDRGQYRQFLWDNSENSAVEEYGSYWKPDYSVRAGDFSDAAVVSEFNDYDIKYLVDVGRWQLTPPTAAYVRVQAVDGVIETVGAEQELNRPPKILSVSSDVPLIDRDVDYAGSGAVDTANITVKAKNCRSRYLLKPLTLWIRDNKDTLTVDGVSVSENTAVDENTLEFTYHFDPSNNLPNDNMGKFDVKIKSLDQFDNENVSGFTELGHELFAVDDRETTINYSPEQMLYSGDEVTIGGEVSGFYESVSLDNVVLKDSVDGTFQPDILGNDSWEVTYSVSQGRHEVTVGVLDKGSRLDGSETLKFDVEGGKSQPSFNPAKQNLSIDLQVGLYQGREPTKGGRIEFEPSSKFRPGDRVTVVAYLTVNGIKISHADITGSWNSSSFPIGDKKGNRFVGTFTIPKDTKSGSYLVGVNASARGLQSTASKTITVQRAKKGINLVKLIKDYWFIIVIAIILLLIVLE